MVPGLVVKERHRADGRSSRPDNPERKSEEREPPGDYFSEIAEVLIVIQAPLGAGAVCGESWVHGWEVWTHRLDAERLHPSIGKPVDYVGPDTNTIGDVGVGSRCSPVVVSVEEHDVTRLNLRAFSFMDLLEFGHAQVVPGAEAAKIQADGGTEERVEGHAINIRSATVGDQMRYGVDVSRRVGVDDQKLRLGGATGYRTGWVGMAGRTAR